MISKEAFRLLVANASLTTNKTQEELAIGMGYGKNYISEILSPTGKLTDKFVNAFKQHYKVGLENPNNGVEEPQAPYGPTAMQVIADLTASNRMLAQANLILANKINSAGTGEASGSSDQKTEQQPGHEEHKEEFLGKGEIHLHPRRTRKKKGIAVGKGK